jgi:hypothetical protein
VFVCERKQLHTLESVKLGNLLQQSYLPHKGGFFNVFSDKTKNFLTQLRSDCGASLGNSRSTDFIRQPQRLKERSIHAWNSPTIN